MTEEAAGWPTLWRFPPHEPFRWMREANYLVCAPVQGFKAQSFYSGNSLPARDQRGEGRESKDERSSSRQSHQMARQDLLLPDGWPAQKQSPAAGHGARGGSSALGKITMALFPSARRASPLPTRKAAAVRALAVVGVHPADWAVGERSLAPGKTMSDRPRKWSCIGRW